jgi:hypothetical protein
MRAISQYIMNECITSIQPPGQCTCGTHRQLHNLNCDNALRIACQVQNLYLRYGLYLPAKGNAWVMLRHYHPTAHLRPTASRHQQRATKGRKGSPSAAASPAGGASCQAPLAISMLHAHAGQRASPAVW